MYKHTIIKVDDKCLDLLLTDDEIKAAFERALHAENDKYINPEACCSCWPIDTHDDNCCPFWKEIFGLCEECGG